MVDTTRRLSGRRTKEWWAQLDPHERRRLAELQFSRSGRYGGYLPDDCSECSGCGNPMLGTGMCRDCYNEYAFLVAKANKAMEAKQ